MARVMGCISLFQLALLAPLGTTHAVASDYYTGKTLEFVVGAAPGGGYDIYGRAVSRHLGRHIPGAPTIVVKNMPGAGSAKAAQYIAGIAPKDGTSIAGVMPGAIMGPLLDDRTAPLFDPTRVRYIGTANSGVRVCVSMKGSKIGSFADAQKVKAKLGAIGPNDSTYDYAYLHKNTGGALWDVVSGYRGTAELSLAMERGEVDGICGWDWSGFKSQKADWLRDNKVNVLMQASVEPHPELTRMGVPTAFDFAKDEDSRKVLELVVSQTVFHRSYIAPPETPPEQLAVLRKAFDDTMADKAFLADAEKVGIDIEPLPGAKVQDVVAKLYAVPPAIVERARKSIRPD